MYTDTPANSTFDGPITILLSVLCILIEVLWRAHAKGGKGLSDFSFGAFIGRFQSDGAESMEEKGLTFSSACLRNSPGHVQQTLSAYG